MTLSVVLCTYNGERFLREQLDSVLSQTLLPDEIVVLDDCSKDDTWNILLEYKMKYPSMFKIYRNKENVGVHENYRKLFHYASCELVAICDQDDIWLPSKLDESVKMLSGFGRGMVCCCERILYKDGRMEDYNLPILYLKDVIFNSYIRGHLMVCSKEILEVCDITHDISYDGAISLYAIGLNKMLRVNMIGCIWRRHDNTVTTPDEEVLEQIGKWNKWFRAMKMIIDGRRSEPIARLMNATAIILDRTLEVDKVNRLCAKMARMMSKQSFFSMLMADWLYLRVAMLSDDFHGLGTRGKLGRMAFAFCYPTMWWYDWRDEKYL